MTYCYTKGSNGDPTCLEDEKSGDEIKKWGESPPCCAERVRDISRLPAPLDAQTRISENQPINIYHEQNHRLA